MSWELTKNGTFGAKTLWVQEVCTKAGKIIHFKMCSHFRNDKRESVKKVKKPKVDEMRH